MILALSLQGRLRNFRLPAYRALVPVFEGLMNSVHAIDASGRPSGRVTVEVLRRQSALPLTESVPKSPPTGFRISDDGVGFTDDNYSSFCTSDSTYKLKLGGRGIGRFTWLKAFESVRIESVYAMPNGKLRKRAFTFSDQGIPDNEPQDCEAQPIGTIVTLEDVHREYAPHIPRKLDTLTQRIVDHCFMAVRAATAKIELVVIDGNESVNVSDEIRRMFETALFDDIRVAGHDFRVTHVRVAARDAGPHRLAFLANSREVRSERLENSVPQLSVKLGGGNGEPFWWLSLVESRALDDAVSSERDSFDIPEEPLEMYPDLLSMALLKKEVLPVVRTRLAPFLAPVRERAEERVRRFVEDQAPEYRHLLAMRLDDIQALPPDLSDERLDAELHRVTYQVEVDLRARGARLLATEAHGADDYAEYISEANAVGKANLAKYIVHRRVMLNLFRRALERNVEGKYELEQAVHQIIFPLRTTSDEVPYDKLNLWMIDERLAYHYYLASDKELRSMDVLASNSQQRPDLIVFNSPFAFVDQDVPFGSVVVIEFKRPARNDYEDDDNPIKQVYDYIRKIRGGTAKDRAGRPMIVPDAVPFYCYVVCDKTPKLREIAQNYQLTEAPDGLGYFGFNPSHRAYVEVMTFDKLVGDAEKRNRILFTKLNLPK